MKIEKDGNGWSVFILDDQSRGINPEDWTRIYHAEDEHAYQRCQLFTGLTHGHLSTSARIADEWRAFREYLI